MTLIAEELAAVGAEIAATIVGLPVHKVVQPDAETVLLDLRGRWLLLSCSARGGRMHLVAEKPAGTGEAAPAYCMLLRKHLVGTRLGAVRTVEGERACELELVGSDETYLLRLFLFGPAAQLQLVEVSKEGARVLGAIGPARRSYDALPAPHPHAASAKTSRFPASQGSISRQIEDAYARREHALDVGAARRQALQRLAARAKKLDRLVEALVGDLARVESAETRRKEADLLLAHLAEIPRGADRVTLPDDFTDGAPIEIALDPARSPKDNAARLYKEHQRLHRARGAIERRLGETRAARAALAREEVALTAASDEAVLADARLAPPAPTPGEQRRAEAERRARPYKRFLSTTGVPIYVGRGAAKNDELTFKVARGNDLWLHTRDVPGAHVVVPLEGGRAADPETLVDAATLAAHHSTARDEEQVDVGYALRKHVRKAKGAAPGAVLVAQQKTIRVRMEAARLRRLLGTLG